MTKKNIIIVGLLVCLVSVGSAVFAEDTDTTAPAAVTNLAAGNASTTTLTLTWTAPGDDNNVGTATAYDLRYSTAAITEANFASSTVVTSLPTPQIAGASETKIVTGLTASTTYYFALKTRDNATTTNWSTLSNVASATTLALPAPTPTADLTFEINVTPATLNTASQGQWIAVHLFITGYSVSGIDFNSLKLNGTLAPDPSYKGTNYFDKGNKNKERNSASLVLKFNRAQFVALAAGQTGSFTVTLTGTINDKTFTASDTVELLQTTPDPDNTIVTSTSSPEVYIIKNGKKRHIPSVDAFNRLGLKWANVKKISLEELSSYLEDTLIKTADDPAVYILCNGLKRHVPSVEVFNSYGFNWADISIVSGADLADYPTAELIRAAGDSKVYQLTGGKKHWVKTLEAFNQHRFRWENVVIINQTEAAAIPEGSSLE